MSATEQTAPVHSVVDAVARGTADPRIRESMLLGALLEGGNWDGPWAEGDHGTSGGPFQIHWTVHDDVRAEATRRGVTPAALVADPSYAVSKMLPEYRKAVGQVPAALWQSDPERAAEQAAFLAEKPAQDYYAARGTGVVQAAWKRVQAQLSGTAAPQPADGATAPPAAGSTAAPTTTETSYPGTVDVKVPLPWAPDLHFTFPWLRISLFLLGLVLIVLGLKVTVGSAMSPAGAAAALAGA